MDQRNREGHVGPLDYLFKLEPPISPVQEWDRGSPPFVAQNVIVLAKNFNLTKPQFDVLNRGLTFIPAIDIRGLNYKDKEIIFSLVLKVKFCSADLPNGV